MSTLESVVLSYLANSLWQVPLLLAGGCLAVRAVRSLGPAAEHRVWIAVLILQALLPAASTIPMRDFVDLLSFSTSALNIGQPHVSVVMGPGTTFGDPHIPAWLLACLAIAYSAVIVWFAGQFVWRIYSVGRLIRSATAFPLAGDIAEFWKNCEEMFGVEGAKLSTTNQISGPITVGVRRKLVLLPAEMIAAVPDAELRTAIAHEFAHMQRRDFLKNLIYEGLSLPVRFHPALRFTRERLMETREMICDGMAAGIGNQQQYARSLLRLASMLVAGASARTPHAIGMFDTTTFERRVMRLTKQQTKNSRVRRIASAAACTVLGIGMCATGLALSVHVDAIAASDDQGAPQTKGTISVSPEKMESKIVHKVNPVYPPEAKKARIQGKVVLDAVISKTGEMEHVDVVSGPKELQQSALDAVRQWTYKPYLLNGEPVEVRTTIHVNYTLAEKKSPEPEKK